VVDAGLSEYAQGLDELGVDSKDTVELELLLHDVERSMERAKKRELASLSRGLPVLGTISSSAPFVGLFGTVFGIITAFEKMADPSKGGGGLSTVSAGIAEALLTTAVGLAVAIITVWFYNFFTTRVDQLGGLIDDASGELSNRLLRTSKRRARQVGASIAESGATVSA
jgi:biopolymer transport protein ExbB/TolQ